MGANDAIKAAASQPIGKTVGLGLSADYKKQQALMNSYNTTRGIYESVEAYQERIAKFRLELAKKIKEENTTIAEKKYNEIQDLALFKTNDPWKLKQGLNQISSLKNFNCWNITNPIDLSTIEQQQQTAEEKLYKLKQGQQTDTNTASTSGTKLYNGTFQNQGERDFLS